MKRIFAIFCLASLSSIALQAQTKSYSSYEDYCADNPHAPTCLNGKPLKYDPNNNPLLKQIEDSCKKFPNSPECKDWCAKEPGSPACKPAPKTGQAQQQPQPNLQATPQGSQAAQAMRARAHKGPSIIELPGAPSPAQLAAVKTLGLHPDWRFADPHADLLIGVNAAALRQSPTLRALLLQLAPSLKLTSEDVDSQLSQMGDVDQLWFSSHSGEPVILLLGPRAVAPAGPTNLSNGMVAYGVSHGAVLLGHSAPAAAAVQRLQSTTDALSAAALQMKAQGTESDIWVMGARPMLNQLKIQASSLSEDLSSFVLGVGVRDGLKAELKLGYTTVDGARRALAVIQKSPPPPEWPVHVTSEMLGTSVRLKVAVDQAELSKALDKALAAPAAQPVLEMLAKSVQRSTQFVITGPDGTKVIQAPPSTPPPPGKMVIYGLPGGPKVM